MCFSGFDQFSHLELITPIFSSLLPWRASSSYNQTITVMKIELGVKVSRAGHEGISTNLRISNHPLFLSIETKTMFILTANLKGYPREKLKIDINRDGTEIAIIGEKSDDGVVRGFTKVFRIPGGVVLDGIDATFSQEGWVLKISMPKSVKWVTGVGIEEVKEEEGGTRTISEAPKAPDEKNGRESQKPDHQEVEGKGNDGVEAPHQETVVDDDRKGPSSSTLEPSRKSKLCSPCFLAGSAILVSIIAIVVHCIRPKKN